MPSVLWFNGRVVDWADGNVHITSEVAVRGATVFEGLRSYWHASCGRHFILDLEAHLDRLRQSATILRFPDVWSLNVISDGIKSLVRSLRYEENLYVRVALYIDHPSYGFRERDTQVGAYAVAYPVPRSEGCEHGIRCRFSSWRRAPDAVAPPRAKSGAFYQMFRLPRIEAEETGYDDFILMNMHGTVAEASGASVFVVRNGTVSTPPLTADILEGITRRRVMELLSADLGLSVTAREIDRTELYVADEVFLAGTLTEIQPVVEIDGYVIGDGTVGRITSRCRDRYFEICASGDDAPEGWLTRVGSPL